MDMLTSALLKELVKYVSWVWVREYRLDYFSLCIVQVLPSYH